MSKLPYRCAESGSIDVIFLMSTSWCHCFSYVLSAVCLKTRSGHVGLHARYQACKQAEHQSAPNTQRVSRGACGVGIELEKRERGGTEEEREPPVQNGPKAMSKLPYRLLIRWPIDEIRSANAHRVVRPCAASAASFSSTASRAMCACRAAGVAASRAFANAATADTEQRALCLTTCIGHTIGLHAPISQSTVTAQSQHSHRG